jgi:hypothetical protein
VDVVSLLREAREAGLVLAADRDNLVVHGPRSASPVVERLRGHKDAILEYMQSGRAAHAAPGDDSQYSQYSHNSSHWGALLGRAAIVDPELARRLDLFRACGCALAVVDGLVFFGPHEDFGDCDWADEDDWWHDHDHYLGRPYGALLSALLAGLVSDGEEDLPPPGWDEGRAEALWRVLSPEMADVPISRPPWSTHLAAIEAGSVARDWTAYHRAIHACGSAVRAAGVDAHEEQSASRDDAMVPEASK